jgi:hypothetical protein
MTKTALMQMLVPICALITFIVGGMTGAWTYAHNVGTRDEETRQHFLKLDAAVAEWKGVRLELGQTSQQRDNRLTALEHNVQKGEDDRNAIRDMMKTQNDNVLDWLHRIDQKISQNPSR